MQLAQHLLDKERVIYQAGAWTLPSHIDADDLPHSLSEARKRRIQALEPSARELARCIALCSKESFSYRNCLELSVHRDKTKLNSELNALVVSEILSTNGERYSLSHASWRHIINEDIDGELAKGLHLRLAKLLERNGNEQFRVTQHFLLSDEKERAIDFFLKYINEDRRRLYHDTRSFVIVPPCPLC